MKNKFGLLFSLLLIATLVLAACGGGAGTAPEFEDPGKNPYDTWTVEPPIPPDWPQPTADYPTPPPPVVLGEVSTGPITNVIDLPWIVNPDRSSMTSFKWDSTNSLIEVACRYDAGSDGNVRKSCVSVNDPILSQLGVTKFEQSAIYLTTGELAVVARTGTNYSWLVLSADMTQARLVFTVSNGFPGLAAAANGGDFFFNFQTWENMSSSSMGRRLAIYKYDYDTSSVVEVPYDSAAPVSSTYNPIGWIGSSLIIRVTDTSADEYATSVHALDILESGGMTVTDRLLTTGYPHDITPSGKILYSTTYKKAVQRSWGEDQVDMTKFFVYDWWTQTSQAVSHIEGAASAKFFDDNRILYIVAPGFADYFNYDINLSGMYVYNMATPQNSLIVSIPALEQTGLLGDMRYFFPVSWAGYAGLCQYGCRYYSVP